MAYGLIALLMLCRWTLGAEPKRVLLIGQGPDGHPPNTHEFMAGLTVLEKCLKPVKELTLTTVRADEPWSDGPKLLADADGVILYLSQGSRWMQTDPRRYEALTRLAQRGGGIVALHWAVGAHDEKYIDGQVKLLGGSRGGPQRKYTVADFDVRLPNARHPIVTGIEPFEVNDEFYYRLDFTKGKPAIVPLLAATIDGRDETVAWAWERSDGGRSFSFVGMHFHRNWGLATYRRLAAQGLLWAVKLPIPEKGLSVEIDKQDLELKR
jgi:type 1 glutamine amidotransferase